MGKFSAKHFPTLVSFPTVLEGTRIWKMITPSKFESTPAPETNLTKIEIEATQSAAPPIPEKNLTDVTISILNGSGTPGQASNIAQALTDAGFSKISAGNATRSTSSKTLVLFAPNLSSRIKEIILEELKPFELDYKIQVNNETNQDVAIITASKN